MFGLDTLGKAVGQLVNGFETNVRQGQQQLEKALGDAGVLDAATLSTITEMSDAYRTMAEDLLLHPLRFAGAELDLARKHAALGYYTLARLVGKHKKPVVEPEADDRRFQAEEWHKHLPFDVLHQAYLINSQAFLNWAASMEGIPPAGRDQMLFYARHLTSALSPSNFPATNPEVLRITWERKGMNLIDGGRQLIEDLRQNPSLFNVGMTDRSAFEVGRNLATT